MNSQDEKYFESLVGAKPEAEAEYDVELAKAETAAPTPRARARVPKMSDPAEPEGQLTVDVFQTPDTIIVESAIAGVRPEDIDINVTPDSVSIRGSREREQQADMEDYLYQECYWGRFARSIILPQEVDPENADVKLKNGILTIRLPKANKRKSRKLSVRTE